MSWYGVVLEYSLGLDASLGNQPSAIHDEVYNAQPAQLLFFGWVSGCIKSIMTGDSRPKQGVYTHLRGYLRWSLIQVAWSKMKLCLALRVNLGPKLLDWSFTLGFILACITHWTRHRWSIFDLSFQSEQRYPNIIGQVSKAPSYWPAHQLIVLQAILGPGP